jgi:hypothetical protein
MAQPAAPTGPGRDAAAADGLVWAACFAAALLVAQQVAAKATRDALFLSNFPVTVLPIVSGLTAGCSLLGVLVFSRGMARSSPPVMMRWGLAANAILLVAAWSLALAAPPLAAVAVYLQTGIFGATLISGFWSVVNERFDPHTARRVVGRIGTGASLGGVLGGVLTWRAAALIGVPNMLLAMAALTLACLAVLETVHRTAESPPSPATAPSVTPPGATDAFHLIRAQPYLRNVALLIALCALTEAVLDFLLSAAATTRFTSGGALISFFALYHTTVGLLALGVQTAVARHSLERLGLGGTLGVQPAVVALGGLAAALMPGFWLRVGLRGAQGVLRNSLFRSAYELLFTPLPPHEKRPTKALLDVGADRLGTIAGSVVVMAILLMPAGAATRALLLLASGLAALTLLLARRLQKGYVGALAESLRAGTVRLDPDEAMDQTTRAMLTAAAAPPRAPEPVKAALPAGSESDPLLDAAASLRSRDDARVRTVLQDAALSPELVRFVVPLLAYDGLFTEAVTALRRLAARCTGELVDVLLDPEEDPVVRRRVPRVLKVVRTQRAVDGLLAALRDERFDVRYRSAQALLRMQEDRSLSIPPAEAFAAAQCELASRPTSRGLEHVFRLLALALPGEPLPVALRAWRRGDASLRGTAREYLENVLPPAVSAALRPWLGAPPPPTSRGLDEVRDDLLRSTASVGLGRRSRTGTGRRG